MSNSPLLLPLPGNEALAGRLAAALGEADVDARLARAEIRRFPDGESYVRVLTPVRGREVVLVSSMRRPDAGFLPLLFAAEAVKEQGAASVGLLAPYLAYMRQDHSFRSGEAVTSIHFGRLLSRAVDWLLTVDPHLHRWDSLAQVYSVPARALPSAPAVAAWLRTEVPDALLIGPDAESAQWVEAVAQLADAPSVILEKTRHGDRDVEVTALPSVPAGRTPVVLDDIISSGRTMIEAVNAVLAAGLPAPTLVGVHAVFADGALEELQACGAARVVTCNTIEHETNAIDVTPLLAEALTPAGAVNARRG